MLLLLLACFDDPGDKPDDTDDTAVDTHDSGHTGESGDDTETGADQDRDDDGYDAGEDCDDSDPDVNPGAEEQCGNGIDDDCDGDPTPCRLLGEKEAAEADALLSGGGANNLTGHDLQRAGDPDGDGRDALWIASAWVDEVAANAGVAWLVEGRLSGTADVTSVAVAAVYGEAAEDHAAGGLDGNVDVTGDGVVDLLLGASESDRGATDAGAVYVIPGPFAGEHGAAELASGIWVGGTANLKAGNAVAGLPAANADGRGGLAIGASQEGGGAGGVYVGVGAPSGERTLDDIAAHLAGEAADDGAGTAVTRAGDWNGDGITDLLVGAPGNDAAGAQAGAAYVVLLPLSGEGELADADFVLRGGMAQDALGFQLGDAGDVDGDGRDDVYVAAPNADDGGVGEVGAVYLLLGGKTGDASALDADGVYVGVDGFVGTSVASAGDVDGDGVPDLVTGARTATHGGAETGAAYLVYQPRLGTVALSGADLTLYGGAADDAMGDRATGAGDLDGDGYGDLAVSADMADSQGRNAGTIHLLYGWGP